MLVQGRGLGYQKASAVSGMMNELFHTYATSVGNSVLLWKMVTIRAFRGACCSDKYHQRYLR